MARYSRLDVWNTIIETGLVPLFYQADLAKAQAIVSACLKSGARVIEFTNRGEQAYPVFSELARRVESSTLLGVGSISDAPTAALFIASGANFIVGPSFNPEIARLCNRRKIAYIPGCATETEIAQAEEFGAEICKVFPGEVLGPEFIRAVLAPSPWHRLMPTGGVDATEENVTMWIHAGAIAVGMGSKLISASRVQAGDFDTIAQQVAQVLEWIRKARARTDAIQ